MESGKTKFVIIILAIGLLIAELVIMDYSMFWAWRNFSGLIAPLLLIAVMIILIRQFKKKDN